jgi:hypothetical protein
MRRAAITSLDTKDMGKQYLDGMGADGEVVDIRTGMLVAERVNGVTRDVLKPTRRDVL